MKPALPLCLACLLTLAACGGQTQSVPTAQPSPAPAEASAPVTSIPLTAQAVAPRPWEGELASLPSRIVDAPEVGVGEQPQLLAQLSEADIFLYGMGEQDTFLLRQGDQTALFDLPYLTPRRYLPQLFWADFDGDGARELLILTYIGSGTGVSVWSPVVVEFEAEGWRAVTLPYGNYDDDLTPYLSCTAGDDGQAVIALEDAAVTISLEEAVDPQAPVELYTGCIVDYGVDAGRITTHLAVGLYQEDAVPYTLYYPADLSAELVYDGVGFSLASPVLSAYSDQ